MSYINNSATVVNSGFAVYLDNVRIDQFVKDYTVNLGVDSNIGSAVINLIYIPDLDKYIHTSTSSSAGTMIKKAIVTVTSAQLMSSPSDSSSVVGTVYIGEKMDWVASDNGNNTWVQVKTKSNITGWIKISKVTPKFEKDTSSAATTQSSGSVTKINEGVGVTTDDGIECMTNLTIFVKNPFSNKYLEVFAGNIISKSVSKSGGEKTLSLQAQDYMAWLNRTVCPIAIAKDSTITKGDRLKWTAQGISINSVSTVNSVNQISFKGKSLSEIWSTLANQTIISNKLYTSPDSVAAWDNAINRVLIMGDIDPNLRKQEVVDYILSSSLTQVDSIYVMMNDVLRSMLIEFYQDRDETIRIKPPFWSEHVLKSHVIDSSLIYDLTENTNYSNMYTRVIATGGLDSWSRSTDTSSLYESMLTPVAVVTLNGVSGNSGNTGLTRETNVNDSSYQESYDYGASAATASNAAQIARNEEGSTDYSNCVKFIEYCYRTAGFSSWGSQTQTSQTLISKGKKITNYNDLRAGDLIFPIMQPGEKNCGSGSHVIIYLGNNQTAEVDNDSLPTPAVTIKELRPKQYIYLMIRIVEGSTTEIQETAAEQIGSDELLKPNPIEQKYGPLIYDCTQPLIKFSTATAVSGSESSYEALTKYAKFMLNYLNSACLMATARIIGMPWLRPGFNVWLSPMGEDKIYYVNSITHYGNANANYTNLNMTMGRKREDFVNGKSPIGSLNPGISDNAFIKTIDRQASEFGQICNYDEVILKAKSFYLSDKTEVVVNNRKSDYYQYFYCSDYSSSSEYGTTTKDASGKLAASQFTSPDSNASTLADLKVKIGTVINITTALNLRSSPSSESSTNIIGKLYNNEKVTITEEENGWYYDAGRKGWVSAAYIKFN